jgi:phage gpG-like protein
MAGRATFTKGAKIERIEKNLGRPAAALKQVGVIMVAESQRAFKDQEHGDNKWEPRAPVNVFGIIADFHVGKKTPPKRRFQSTPALIDTGDLRRKIGAEVKGDVVEVGTVLPYAAVHQTGGKVESKPLTSKVRRPLWLWLKKQSPELKQQIGWVLNKKFKGKKIEATVPARPFVGVTVKTIKKVKKLVGVLIMEVK